MAPNPIAPLRRAAGSAILAAALTCALALPSAAASPLTAVPPEPGVVQLPGIAASALVADLDGDGTAEIVRIAPWAENAGQDAVELWRLDGGTWTLAGKARLRRGTSPDEQRSAVPHPDAAHTLPVMVGDAARLVAWRVAGRERVLAVVNSSEPFNGAPPCCLTVWSVTTTGPGRPPVLTKLADTGRGGLAVYSVDMDGDGTDELVVHEPPDPDRPLETPVSVLRWDGNRFARDSIAIPAGVPDGVTVSVMGDSDGAPGAEIGLVAQMAASADAGWVLNRLSLRRGALVDETTRLESGGVALAVPGAPGSGPLILVGDDAERLAVIDWPAGQAAELLRSDPRRGRPLALIGGEADPWIVLRRGSGPSGALEIIRPGLSLASARAISPSGEAATLLDAPEPPYVGPWPSAGGPDVAYVGSGTLVQVGRGTAPTFTPIASLAGAAPLGWIDHRATQLALARTDAAPAVSAETIGRRGGPLLVGLHLGLAIVPWAVLSTPELDDALLTPTGIDAVPDPVGSGGHAYVTNRRTVIAGLDAPEGTRATSLIEGVAKPYVLGVGSPPVGSDATPIMGTSFQMPFELPPSAQGSSRYRVNVFVSTPGGHGYRVIFDVRLLTSPPSLNASAGVVSFGLDSTIAGSTDPGTRLLVDGASAAVGRDGAFSVSVPSGLVPRDVQLVARDPVGNVTRLTVSVLAPLDYRRLPWIPIIVGLTIVIGGVLFVRVPRPSQRGAPPTVDDGLVEEVEPD